MNSCARALGQASSFVCAATLLASCTLVTDARDYEVDPGVVTRDLDYSFESFPHAGQPLDVAVVNSSKQMQARARILLAPNLPNGEIPVEHLVLTRGLKPGDYELYFFADQNENYMFDQGEHNWIEPVPASGQGSFVHSTTFAQNFNENDFTQLNADIVFEIPSLPAGALTPAQESFRQCAAEKLESSPVFEIKVFLKAESRQVGLFKTYAGNRVSKELQQDGIRLEGILDAGSEYTIEVVLNGESSTTTVTAPADINTKELRVKADQWFPLRVTDCLR